MPPVAATILWHSAARKQKVMTFGSCLEQSQSNKQHCTGKAGNVETFKCCSTNVPNIPTRTGWTGPPLGLYCRHDKAWEENKHDAGTRTLISDN